MWLFSKKIDLLALYAPIWLCWVVLCCLPHEWLDVDLSLWVWVLFVLVIDVGHVWSTIFRTYLDREEFKQHYWLLLAAPILSFLLVFLIAWQSVFLFWRLLAYLALFHFVKQQYGFLALYKKKAKDFGRSKRFNDKWVLYWATLYPVLYWHCTADIQFSWFVENDFLPLYEWFALLQYPLLWTVGNILYWSILLAWFIEEVRQSNSISWGKILWMLTTAWNWYGGIVYFNSDLVFTISNVVAHGIPYLTLIIYYQYQKGNLQQLPQLNWVKMTTVVLLIVIGLAWIEEYCWDMLVYGERAAFFGAVFTYPMEVLHDPFSRAVAIGLLTVPQMTHYIIDGFIWKANAANPYVKTIFK